MGSQDTLDIIYTVGYAYFGALAVALVVFAIGFPALARHRAPVALYAATAHAVMFMAYVVLRLDGGIVQRFWYDNAEMEMARYIGYAAAALPVAVTAADALWAAMVEGWVSVALQCLGMTLVALAVLAGGGVGYFFGSVALGVLIFNALSLYVGSGLRRESAHVWRLYAGMALFCVAFATLVWTALTTPFADWVSSKVTREMLFLIFDVVSVSFFTLFCVVCHAQRVSAYNTKTA